MNETICSITSAIEEGHSWGHSDEEIAKYIYKKHILPLEEQLAKGPDLRAAFLDGFMLSTEGRNREFPFAGDYVEAWKVIGSHTRASLRAFKATHGINSMDEEA